MHGVTQILNVTQLKVGMHIAKSVLEAQARCKGLTSP